MARDAASEIAVRVREARDRGADCRQDEAQLLALLRPLLASEARVVAGKVAGTVQVVDLEQEGALVVLRSCSRYADRGVTYGAYVQPVVRRAMRDYVQLHAQDVRPGMRAQRGLTRWRPVAAVVGSLSSGDTSSSWLDAVEQSAPVESAERTVLEDEQRAELLRAVAQLEEEHRYIVERHYGLNGSAPTSSRELARGLGVSRTSTDGILARALDRLRELLCDAAADC